MANINHNLLYTKWLCRCHVVFTLKYRRKIIYNQYRKRYDYQKRSAVCQKKEKLLISINMCDGCLICIGKGNEDWNFSAPHGDGRLMSRNDDFSLSSLEEYSKEMEDIYTTCISQSTVDEAPMAYKRIDEIIEQIKPTDEIISSTKPVYNFKATDIYSWKRENLFRSFLS